MKIQYSALVNSTSGKLNGSVASHNKGGSYLRNKGIVSNPRTPLQTLQRSRMGSIASTWRTLSPTEQAAWNAAAPDFPYTDPFGQIKYLSGFGLFQRLNLNLNAVLSTSAVLLTVPPAKQNFPVMFNLDFGLVYDATPGPGLPEMQWNMLADFTAAPADQVVQLRFTAGLSQGINNPGSRFRQSVQYFEIPTIGGTLDMSSLNPDVYQELWGVQPVGTRVFVEARMTSLITGETTPWQRTDTVIVAAV